VSNGGIQCVPSVRTRVHRCLSGHDSLCVRVWKARLGTFRTAIKHVIATPLFWLQMVCTAFSLVVGILHRLGTYSIAEIVLEVRTGIFVVFTATCIFAALGFYFGGEFIEKEEDQAP
jgi:hypothetical protein